MIRLYFGNLTAIMCTLMLGVNLGYVVWRYLNRINIQKWGVAILIFILLHSVFWYLAHIRDLYSNSIVYATDGSVGMGLFSVSSIQSIIFWILSVAIWGLGVISIFKPHHRRNIFFIMAILSAIQITFIESSRIWLYYSNPASFDYMCK